MEKQENQVDEYIPRTKRKAAKESRSRDEKRRKSSSSDAEMAENVVRLPDAVTDLPHFTTSSNWTVAEAAGSAASQTSSSRRKLKRKPAITEENVEYMTLRSVDSVPDVVAYEVVAEGRKRVRRNTKEENYELFGLDPTYYETKKPSVRNCKISRMKKKARMEVDPVLHEQHKASTRERQKKHQGNKSQRKAIEKKVSRWLAKEMRVDDSRIYKSKAAKFACEKLEFCVQNRDYPQLRRRRRVLEKELVLAKQQLREERRENRLLVQMAKPAMNVKNVSSTVDDFYNFMKKVRLSDADSYVRDFPIYPVDSTYKEGKGECCESEDSDLGDDDGVRFGYMGRGTYEVESDVDDYPESFIDDSEEHLIPYCVKISDVRAQGGEVRASEYYHRLPTKKRSVVSNWLIEDECRNTDCQQIADSNVKIEKLLRKEPRRLHLVKRKPFPEQDPEKFKGVDDDKIWYNPDYCCAWCDRGDPSGLLS